MWVGGGGSVQRECGMMVCGEGVCVRSVCVCVWSVCGWVGECGERVCVRESVREKREEERGRVVPSPVAMADANLNSYTVFFPSAPTVLKTRVL